MAAMSRARWFGGVVLAVCCAAAAVLFDPPPHVGPVSHPYELTQQNGQHLDIQHAFTVKSCTSEPAKWRDRLSGCQWYLSDSRAEVFDVNVEPAWEATLGEGVTVLVVDYPVDYRHEDLRDNMDPADSPGLTEAAVVGSRTSHGTAMASIIAARDNAVGFRGVAPRASLTWRSINSGTIHSDFALPVAECVEVVAADGSVAGAWAPDCESWRRTPAPARFYTFSLDAPSKVTIDLRSSLDTFLYVRNGHAQRGEPMANDDDGGDGLNSRISRVFPAGVYTIEATTYARKRSSGSFTLQIAGLDGASAPEAIALERRWAPVWDTLLEAAVVNRSYSTVTYTWPTKELQYLQVPPYEVYDTMAEFGFGGRGTLNVVSGGKTLDRTGMVLWSTLAEDRSHPAVVAVCATDRWGRREARWNTSTEGPNLWVCAPVGGIVEAALGDRYRRSNGAPSSPATALVSGVAALVRSIDSNLSWRDVKLILAASAQHNDPDDAGWQHGAAVYGAPQQNYRYHHSYGFGIVDAGAAVALAQDWQYLPDYRSEHAPAPTLSPALAVPDDGTTVTAGVAVDPEIDFVEYVEAHLVLDAPWFRDLEVELESPSGIVSTLSVPVDEIRNPAYAKYDCKQASECGISGSFRFGASVHLGEDPAGTWTLRLTDRRPNGGANTLESWSLRFFGHKSSDPTPNLVPSPTFGPWPQVSITAAADIDEGDDATFTVTADPAPSAPLDVTVTVAQTGDYGVTTGARTVTIPTTGTAALTVSTLNDSADEADGSVTAALRALGGYTVSAAAGTAAVAVADDDEPPAADPEVSITAGGDIDEGSDAAFTVTAVPAPLAALDVTVSVTAAGDFGVSPGSHTVTIHTTGTATLTVATADDSVDEADGSVTAAVVDGSGYSVSQSAGSATVAVADDDDAPCDTATAISRARAAFVWHTDNNGGNEVWFWQILAYLGADPMPAPPGGAALGSTTPEAVRAFSDGKTWPGWVPINAAMSCHTPPPEISITAGADVGEGSDATFTVSAVPAPTVPLAVSVTVAQTGDYGVSPGSHTVTIPVAGTATLTVATTGDSADEADGSVTATLSAGSGYTVSATAGAASVAVADDDDPVPSPTVCVPSLPSDAVTVSVVTGWRDAHSGAAHVLRWNRVLAALGTDTGEAPMTVVLSRANESQFMLSRWDRVTRTLEALAQCADNDAVPLPDPEVSITAGSNITEGGDAVFTISADPAPASPLTVDLTVAQVGDFGVTTGSQSVTVPMSGSVTLSVGTVNDSADEADGSVTVTVNAGSGYTVSQSAGTATVAVADDDDPPPPPPPADSEVSITAGSNIAEGGDAVFTISADPAPASPLTVDLTVAQVGDFGVTTGSQSVTVPMSGSVTLTVATANDSTDEVDGSVTVTVGAGSGYTVSQSAGTAAVAVADDDDPLLVADPGFAVHDASGTEGGALRVRVTLSGAPRTSRVEVYWTTFRGSGSQAATPGADYSTRARGWLAFGPGDTEKWVQIPLPEDDRQEPQEHFLVRLLRVSPYRTGPPIADSQATMTITDND